MREDDLDKPATKRDLATLRIQLEESTDRKLEGLEARLIERITGSETKLLKAFYAYAESNSKRMAALEGNEAAIRGRLATIEDRLTEVERRLNMPPAS